MAAGCRHGRGSPIHAEKIKFLSGLKTSDKLENSGQEISVPEKLD